MAEILKLVGKKPEVNKDLVKFLTNSLFLAKNGEIVAIAAAFEFCDGKTGYNVIGSICPSLVGRVYEMNRGMLED